MLAEMHFGDGWVILNRRIYPGHFYVNVRTEKLKYSKVSKQFQMDLEGELPLDKKGGGSEHSTLI